jgi:IS1 family transposase
VGPLPEKGKGYVANVLPLATRVRIISALVEGNSIRATGRMVEVGKVAVCRLALMVGEGCVRLHNRMVRDLAAYVVQMDEVWSYVQKKEARLTEADPAERGDASTYIALDANTKLVLSFHVGKRDGENTEAFIKDLRARLTVKPHVTSDGWQPYIGAMWGNFSGAVDYAQCVKNYRTGAARGPDHRYEPPRNPFITKTAVIGAPRPELMSTSYVERFNLTSRHIVGRTRRLCLAFSKKLTNHAAAIALGIFSYNFTRIHGTLGVTPAMAAGLTDHPWTIEEVVTAALAEPESEAPVAQPLKLQARPGEAQTPARELPNGRGWLRVVDGGKTAAPSPGTPPAAPAVAVVEVPAAAPIAPVASTAPDALPGQLSLLDWRPKPLGPRQLSLFGEDI